MEHNLDSLRLCLRRLDSYPAEFPNPEQASEYASGIDLRAMSVSVVTDSPNNLFPTLEAVEDFQTGKEFFLQSGHRALVCSGLSISRAFVTLANGSRPDIQIRPRSGLALRHGVTVLNAPGTIDADYRGPIQIILYNSGKYPFRIVKGDRVAQLVIGSLMPTAVKIVTDEATQETERGAGGFGSTGIK